VTTQHHPEQPLTIEELRNLAEGLPLAEDPPPWPAEADGGAARADLVADRLASLRAHLLDSAGLDTILPPEPLISDVLYRDSLAWLQGKPGHGKSFLALDWAGCIANGYPWYGNEIRSRGPVLYLIAEGASGFKDRVRAWEAWTGHPMKDVIFLPVAIQLLQRTDVEAFALLALELGAVLVVLDTQARVSIGLEENSAKDMGMLVAAADHIRTTAHACVLLVHHEGRTGENLRGSSAMEGAATTIVRVALDGTHLRIENPKQKDGPKFSPILLEMVECADSVVLQVPGVERRTPSQAELDILQAMHEAFEETGASPSALLETSGVAKATFYRALSRLCKDGKLIKTGTKARPKYFLPGTESAS
jgi:hypothetical protein